MADVALADRHFAPHYAEPCERVSLIDGAPVYASNDTSSDQRCTLNRGDGFAVLDITGDWAWGYCRNSGKVGYIKADALSHMAKP